MDLRRTPPVGPPRRRTVGLVRGPQDIRDIRILFGEYRDWLATHREVTTLDDAILETNLDRIDMDIAALPGPYGPPRGALLLAREGHDPVGCGALRELRENVGELKRVYVRSTARGVGFGRRIVRGLLFQAQRRAYDRVRLDTLPTMTAAIRLYRAMGFVPIPAYQVPPVPGTLAFEYRFRRRVSPPPRSARSHGST